MNNTPAAKRRHWLALVLLVAAAAASAPIFLGDLQLTHNGQGPRERLTVDVLAEYPAEPLAGDLQAFASPLFAERLSLLSDASELVPVDTLANTQAIDVGPGSVSGDRSADHGSAGGANTYAGLASGSLVAGGNAPLATTPPAVSNGPMPGGLFAGAATTIAAGSGGTPGAVSRGTLPQSLSKQSAGRPSTNTQSPTSATPAHIVANVGRANLEERPTELSHTPSSRTARTDQDVRDSSRYVPGIAAFASAISASAPADGLSPNSGNGRQAEQSTISDEHTSLPSPVGALFPEVNPSATDAAAQDILAAIDESLSLPSSLGPTALEVEPPAVVLFDAPTAQLQAQDPNQIPEPATLALGGLSLIVLAFSRRKQQHIRRRPAPAGHVVVCA